MSASIINLRRARKAKTRVDHAAKGEANRLAFGRSKNEIEKSAAERLLESRRLDGAKLESTPSDDAD